MQNNEVSGVPEVDLNEFEGLIPYASEIVGVYQPLIGWRGRQVQARREAERHRLLGGLVDSMLRDSWVRQVALTSEDLVTDPPPLVPEWVDAITRKSIMSTWATSTGPRRAGAPPVLDKSELLRGAEVIGKIAGREVVRLRAVTGNRALRERRLTERVLSAEAMGAALLGTNVLVLPLEPEKTAGSETPAASFVADPDDAIRNGVIGAFEKLGLYDPNGFTARPAWWLVEQFLVDTTPKNVLDATLAPIGILHFFRHFFYDLTTFSGPSVDGTFVSAGGTSELYQVTTRRSMQERLSEYSLEMSRRSDSEVIEKEELSAAVSEENISNTSLGVSASGGFNAVVVQGSASAEFALSSSVKRAASHVQTHSRQQTDRVSTELRRNYRTTFKETLGREDMSSRRHLLTNPTKKLVNFEFRRRMRLVGVQVRHTGSQLAWNVYVDDPGGRLGLARLIHIAKPMDGGEPLPPEAPLPLPVQSTDFSFRFPFAMISGSIDDNATYVAGTGPDGRRIDHKRTLRPPAPAAGYSIAGVAEIAIEGGDPGKWRPRVAASYKCSGEATVDVTLDSVTFYGNPDLRFTLKLTWQPPDQTADFAAYRARLAKIDADHEQRLRKDYFDQARERIRSARGVQKRPHADLRAEERHAIYSRLVQQLTAGGIPENNHALSEIIGYVFDLDAMLYFVAPDWWKPARRGTTTALLTGVDGRAIDLGSSIGGSGPGSDRPDYPITEDSEPAALGSSLGWLLQLDGDDHRNAFLNSAWVKAVLPIREGLEQDAIDWLKRSHVEGVESFDTVEKDVAKLIAEIRKKSKPKPKPIREAAGATGPAIEEPATPEPITSDERTTLGPEQEVYETGFSPLVGGFRIDDGAPYSLMSDWWEVVPTDQIDAFEVNPTSPIRTGSIKVKRPATR